MPPQNLPEKAKKVYLSAEKSAEKTCPQGERHEECVARKAWAAVKRGWKQEGDKWVPKATAELSLYISKAYIDNDTEELRWVAVNSDTDPDSYNDEMTLGLYDDFLSRIESKELPPERHRSEYWSGGMPYLSISHYPDLNGRGVPGKVQDIYIDGDKLKSRGTFYNTVLGKAAYKAVRENFSEQEEKSEKNKVRISIAFVDWGHEHKSNGYIFERESLDDICPECLKELFIGGEGKVFKKGHLIHLALTRVPVNERTSMEVRSMTTQEEDSKSIIGEEVHKETFDSEDIEELKANLVIKSEQDEEEEVELIVAEEEEKGKHEMKKDDDDEEEEEKKKKEEKKADLKEEPVIPHILTPAIESFLATYDHIASVDAGYQEKLQAIQNAFEQFGEAIKASFAPTPEEKEQETLTEIKSMFNQLLSRLDATDEKIAILEQKSLSADPKSQLQQSVRRSLQLGRTQAPAIPALGNAPMSIRDIVCRTT